MAVLCLVVLAAYYEVPFRGRTFSTAPSVLGVEGCGRPSGACTAVAADDLRQDPSASAWALEPWGRVTHDELAQRTVPLWDPYQAAGTPLAANMQSAVFDPLLVAYHLHPTLLVLDLTLLAGLLLMALAAYLAARVIRLAPLAATVAASVYALSGWFFRFSNNQWFRAYLFLPLLIVGVEWLLRSRRRLPIAAVAVAVAGLVLIGMPEPTFITLVAVGVYALVRLFVGPRVHDRPRAVARLAVGGALGVALAAPVLLPFAEYVPLSFNSHSNLGSKASGHPVADEPPQLADAADHRFGRGELCVHRELGRYRRRPVGGGRHRELAGDAQVPGLAARGGRRSGRRPGLWR